MPDETARTRGASQERSQPMIEPYRGTVTARFSDAVIASTENALVLKEDGKEPAYFFPFEDIYFEFLQEKPARMAVPSRGVEVRWSAWAVGVAADDVMRSYEEPEGVFVRTRSHGMFDPQKIDIEAHPAEDIEHTPHFP